MRIEVSLDAAKKRLIEIRTEKQEKQENQERILSQPLDT